MKQLWVLLSLTLLMTNNSYADNDYIINDLGTGIYYHQGVHEDASEQNLGAIANVSFVIGEQCVAVIDSGGSYLEGKKTTCRY
jgi:hypothetical protein